MTDWVKALAQYNEERARGIVHTPEWDERMTELQARYDKNTADEAEQAAAETVMRRRLAAGLPVPNHGFGFGYREIQ
jgi:hypothetical protein